MLRNTSPRTLYDLLVSPFKLYGPVKGVKMLPYLRDKWLLYSTNLFMVVTRNRIHEF